ncbi:MAG: hypothetical protein LC650_00455 [Actinobacteria bacterium]|nr:hypothetical protein [Actinomycetota bacterium]
MRPNEQKFAVRTSGSEASVRMSFDEESVAFLMDALTNLYSDPVTAPIRETISNAIDSHVEAGVTRPVEVTRPTTHRPVFEVRDYGVGMNVDTALKVYGKYGYSTKRHTNDQIGMMGLGSKAALTYTDSFNVIAVKDGIRLFGVVSRGTDGGGGVDIKDTSRVDEPDGVIVQVPVSDVGFFNMKLNSFVKYAQPGTMLVDGDEPSAIAEAKLGITDRIFMFSDDYRTLNDVIVSGGVPYDAAKNLSQNLPYGHRVVAYVDIGDVDMPPNRESLHYTDKTNAALAHIREVIKREVKVAAQAAVNGAETHTDAIQVATRWRAFSTDLTYNGLKITDFRYGKQVPGYMLYRVNRHRNAAAWERNFHHRPSGEILIITNFPNATLGGSNRTKIRNYLGNNGLESVRDVVLLRAAELDTPWDDGYKRVDWSVIKAIKLPRSSSGRTVGNGEVTYYDGEYHDVEYEKVPSTDIILVTPPETKPKNGQTTLVLNQKALLRLLPGKVLVILEKNRHDKFRRHYPKASFMTLHEAVEQVRKTFFDNLNDDQYALLFKPNDGSQLVWLDEDNILDPDVQTAIRRAKTNVEQQRRELQAIRELYRSQVDSFFETIEREVPESTVLDDYPMARYTDRNNAEHVEQYINAMYRSEQ